MFSSNPYDYVITSLAWAPNGEYFAVGAYEMLRLCDKTGWSYSFDKIKTGTITKICWSPDGTVCAGSGGNGRTCYAQLIDRSLSWSNWEVQLIEDKVVRIIDLLNEVDKELNIPERVINMSLNYDHLILTTTSQCHIYSL